MISSLPTIFHIKDGVWRDFGNGKRKKKDLQDFIRLKKWETIEPFYFLDPGKDFFRYEKNTHKLACWHFYLRRIPGVPFGWVVWFITLYPQKLRISIYSLRGQSWF
jgi:hypothetical protein